MQLAGLANRPASSLSFAIEWRDSSTSWIWQHWKIQTATTQHEIANQAIRIDIGQASPFYSGDGRPTSESVVLMAGCQLAFQECASLTTLAREASHGDFPGCFTLFQEVALLRLGLYHCNGAILPALKQASLPYPSLFVSEDGLQYDFLQQQFFHTEYPL